MRKKNKNTLLWAIFIAIIIAGGLFTVQQFGVDAGTTVTYVSPDWTQLVCDVVNFDTIEEYSEFESGDDPDPHSFDSGEDYTVITCDEFTKRCYYDIYFEADFQDQSSIFCDAYVEVFDCAIGGSDCTGLSGTVTLFDGWHDLTNQVYGRELNVRAWYTSGWLCNDVNEIDDGVVKIRKTFDHYGLKVMGDTAYQEIPGTCQIPNSYKGRIPAEGFISTLDFNDESNKYVSFVNEWNPVTINSVYTYEGELVYCTGAGNLYSFEELDLADGSEQLLAPTTYVDRLACCPWMRGCLDDFTWDPEADTECDTDFDCNNNGQFYGSGGYAVRESCVDDECVIMEQVQVECDGPEDCPGGYCDMRGGDPGDWMCKSGSVPVTYCGDGICNGDDTQLNCPNDCSAPRFADFPISSTLIFIVLGVIVVILVMVAVSVRMKSKGKR